jgi:hypothetical protein
MSIELSGPKSLSGGDYHGVAQRICQAYSLSGLSWSMVNFRRKHG